MDEYFQQAYINQYNAALAMLRCAVAACPPEHWEEKIASGTFRWVAYHTLFFADLYLSPSADAFALRELHQRGGDEREDRLCPGLDQDETLAYLDVVRQKVSEALRRETAKSLQGPSGIPWYKISRGELHFVNIRHIQHHTGALYAYLRRVDESLRAPANSLRWVGSGWH